MGSGAFLKHGGELDGFIAFDPSFERLSTILRSSLPR